MDMVGRKYIMGLNEKPEGMNVTFVLLKRCDKITSSHNPYEIMVLNGSK